MYRIKRLDYGELKNCGCHCWGVEDESKATESEQAEGLPVWERVAFLQLSLGGVRRRMCCSSERSVGSALATGRSALCCHSSTGDFIGHSSA